MIRKGFLAGGILGVITSLGLMLIIEIMDFSPYSIAKTDIFVVIEHTVYLIIALMPGFLLGGFTGAIFGFTLVKIQHRGVKFYVATCVTICILILSPLYIYVASQTIELYRLLSAGFLDGHTAMSFDVLVIGAIIFSAIYLFTGYLGSLYLYNLYKSSNVQDTSS